MSGHADTEDIPNSQIENQFGRRTRINAAQDHRNRILTLRCVDELSTQIACQSVTAEETLVPFFEDSQHFQRRQVLL